MATRDGTTTNFDNDCPEVALEAAAERIGYGKLTIEYSRSVPDTQIDMTPAFCSSPSTDQIYWSDTAQIDFATLDKTSTYFVRTGLNNESGHWQILFFDRAKGWNLFSTQKKQLIVADVNSVLTNEGKQKLFTAGNKWGLGEKQQSIYLLKASKQNIINGANFVYLHRNHGQDDAIRAVESNNTKFIHEIIFTPTTPPAKKTGVDLEVGTRKQCIDQLVSRYSSADPVNKSEVRIQLITGDQPGQGIPKDQLENVLNNSFGLRGTNPVINSLRHHTKWRSITSTVQLLGNQDQYFKQAPSITVTTGCMPNLGDKQNHPVSPEDRKRYVDEQGEFTPQYEADITLLIQSWFAEQSKYDVDTIVMPLVGTGVYMTDALREKGAELITKVIEKQAQAHLLATNNKTKRIILAHFHPKSKHDISEWVRTGEPKLIEDDFVETHENKADVFTIIPAIMKENGVGNIGVINAGADNNIGGACAIEKKDGKPSFRGTTENPFEEQLADFTTLIFEQSLDFNPKNVQAAIEALGVKAKVQKVETAASKVPATQSNRLKHQNIDALIEVFQKLDFDAREKFVQEVNKGTEVIYVGSKGNFYVNGLIKHPALIEDAKISSQSAVDTWLVDAIKREFADYEKSKDKNSYKLAVYKMLIPHLGSKIKAEGVTSSSGNSDVTLSNATGALTWLQQRASAKRLVIAAELVENKKLDREKLSTEIKESLSQAQGKKLVVMSSLPDFKKDPDDLNTPSIQLVKVYEPATDKPIFADNQALANALNKAANMTIKIKDIDYRITGKVEQGMVAFYKKGSDGKEEIITAEDVKSYGTDADDNNLSEAVMSRLKTSLKSQGIASELIKPAGQPARRPKVK